MLKNNKNMIIALKVGSDRLVFSVYETYIWRHATHALLVYFLID